MTNDVFLYYYGLDGEEGTTEDDLKQYYEENNARVRYIKFNLTDGNGEALDDAGKKDMKAKVEDYLGEINALKGDEDAMEDEMDTVQSDYNAYVTSISEEAAAATATSATDADGNEIPATRERQLRPQKKPQLQLPLPQRTAQQRRKLPATAILRRPQQPKRLLRKRQPQRQQWRLTRMVLK